MIGMNSARLADLIKRQKKIRCLGIDDGPFAPRRHSNVLVVGAVYCGIEFEGLLTTHVRQDGRNATDRLSEMIFRSKFCSQIHLVMLNGLTVGGFNVVDLPRLAQEIGLPCVAVMRKRPDMAAIKQALKFLPRPEERLDLLARAGEIHRAGPLFFQAAEVEPELAAKVIAQQTIHGHIPECLRAAHLIASGLLRGESGRRA